MQLLAAPRAPVTGSHPSRVGGILFGAGSHRRDDAAVRAKGEELFSARIASIRWKAELPLQEGLHARPDSFAGNMLEVEIAAPWAVGIPCKGDCHAPGIESEVAGVAPPRSQTSNGSQKIENSASV